MGRLKDEEMLRRFIRLATDSIELNEYSNHFAMLAVTWSKPFQQVDVGYIFLPSGVREPWSEQDNTDLRALYPRANRDVVMQRFPTRSWAGIQARAFDKGITREILDRDNNREINDRFLSLRDWEVMQEFDISTLKGCAEVPLWFTNADNVLGTSSGEVTHGN